MPSPARRSTVDAEPAPPLRRRPASERPHVLIVTSDGDLREFLAEGLLLGGFWTSSVASGIQALEVFRLRTFDLVLLDLDVQGFGGIETLRRLLGTAGVAGRAVQTQPLTDVPIVLISAEPDAMRDSDAKALGATALLLPPIELEDLIPALFRVVDSWRAERPGRLYADQASRLGNADAPESH